MSYHKHWNVLIGKQLLEMNTEWFLDCMCLQHLSHSVARCPYCTRSCDMEPGAGVGFTIQGLSFQQEVSIAAAVALGCSPSIRRDHLKYQQLLPVEEIIWETSDYQKYIKIWSNNIKNQRCFFGSTCFKPCLCDPPVYFGMRLQHLTLFQLEITRQKTLSRCLRLISNRMAMYLMRGWAKKGVCLTAWFPAKRQTRW